MTDKTNQGGVEISNISGSIIETGDITTNITAGGDVIGRDQIINNITQIKERVLTIAEEADRAKTIARQRLAEAVTAYVECIGEIAADDQDALQGGPYRSLKAYTLREAEIFFGRDEAMAALLAHLQRGRLTILHAESGAGKSSLLQAGIQYQLIVQGHVPLYIRPYDKSPALAIKQALLPSLDSLPELTKASLRDYLHQVTSVLGSQTILVILIDQFEELFFNLNEEERNAFVGELAVCLEDESLNVRWVLALRTEFFGDLANFRPRIRNPFENDFRLNRLSLENARTVITEPASRLGIEYEPALVETLLNDLRDPDSDEVAPAQLQLVCSALYNLFQEQKQRDPKLPSTFNLAMYETEGRAEGILRGHLDRVLRRTIDDQDRELARQLLIALVSSDQRRIRRTKSELANILADYLTVAQSLDEVLDQLVDSRLLNVGEDEQYELAHDLLLKQIELDPETQARKAAEELLKQEVYTFKRHGTLLSEDKFNIINSQREYLPIDAEAEKLLRLSQEEIEKEAREKEEQRQRELEQARKASQRAKYIIGIGIIAVGLAIVAGFFAWQSNQSATEAKNRREQAEVALGQANELATKEATARAGSNERATAVATAATAEAKARSEAEQNFKDAATARFEAVEYANLAATRAAEAQENANLAATREAEAKQQSRIALARQLAVQSSAAPVEKPLQRFLLAVEALNTIQPDDPYISAPEQALREALKKPMGILFHGHQGKIRVAELSPDGRWYATGSEDGTVRLWSLESPETSPTVLQHNAWISAVAFSPNGFWLATADAYDIIRLWPLKEPGNEIVIGRLENLVIDMAFSSDNRWFAAGSGDKLARLWSMSALDAEPKILDGHLGGVSGVAFSPDGRWLATASHDTSVRLWSLDNLDSEPRVLQGHRIYETLSTDDYGVSDMTLKRMVMAFSPDGRWLATGSDDGKAVLWSMIEAEPEPITLPGHEEFDNIHDLAFSSDSLWLATASWGDTTHIWSVLEPENEPRVIMGEDIVGNFVTFSPSGRWLATASSTKVALWSMLEPRADPIVWRGHEDRISNITFSNDGRWLITASWDNTARLWSVTKPEPEPTLVLESRTFNTSNVAFSPDGNQLAVTGNFSSINLWSMEKPEAGPEILSGQNDVAFSPDGHWLATTDSEFNVLLLPLRETEKLITLSGHEERILDIAFSPDGNWLATAGFDDTARLWSMASPKDEPLIFKHEEMVTAVAFSPDGNWLATSSWDDTAKLWSIKNLEAEPIVYPHEWTVDKVEFSPNGDWLVTASDDLIYLWEAGEPETKPIILRGHQSGIGNLIFSPNGRWLVTSGAKRSTASNQSTSVFLWSMADLKAEPVEIWHGGETSIYGLAFSANGQLLATASNDNKIRIWNMNLDELKTLACNLAGRNFTFEEWQQYLPNQDYPRTCPDFPPHPSIDEVN